VLDTNRHTDQVLGDTRGGLLLVGELLVGGGGGVDNEGLRITNVRQVGSQLQAVNNGNTSLFAALNTEREHTTESALEVLLGQLVAGVALETRVGHPRNALVLLEPPGQSQRVGGVALNAQAEGLETLDQLEGAEGVQAAADVTQDLDTHADRERDGAEGLVELQAVVSLGGLVELRETLGVLAPVELARVDDDTRDGGTVATDPLGGGVDDNVSTYGALGPSGTGKAWMANTVLNGTDEETSSAEGVVNNQGDTLLLTDLGDGLEVGDVVLGVSDGLDVDSLGLVVNGSTDVLGFVAVHELGLDSKAGEHDLELVVGSSVQEGGRHDVVTGVRESGNGHELSALARGGGHSGNSPLQRSDTLLENIDRRLQLMSEWFPGSGEGYTDVHDTAVDVTKLLESEKTRAMGGVVENEGLFDPAISNSITPSRTWICTVVA
jgi:hypothetical protein